MFRVLGTMLVQPPYPLPGGKLAAAHATPERKSQFLSRRASCLGPHESLGRDTLASLGLSERPCGVSPHGSRNDERLSVINHKGLKGGRRALPDGVPALNQVQDIHATVCIVGDSARKPVTPRLDKLARMQSRMLFPPTLPICDGDDLVDEVTTHPSRGSVPLDIGRSMIEMNWTRQPIQ